MAKSSNLLKNKNKILVLSCMLALFFGLADAVLDYLIHYDKSFIQALFYDEQEVYFRLLVSATFLTYGLILSRMFAAKEQALNSFQTSENKYRSLIQSIDDSIYVVDRQYRYCFINNFHLSRLGQTKEELIGKEFGEIHSSEETKLFLKKVDKAFKTGKSMTYTYKSFRDDRYMMQTYSPIKNKYGEITHVTIVSKNITDMKKIEEQLHKSSITDEMTGLYNRRGFFALAEHNLKMITRSNSRSFLLYADMDNLKKINDNLGHKEGDAAIIAISTILKETYRETDIIARIGGDEFIVFPVETSEASSGAIIARLQRNIEIYNTIVNHDYTLSVSVGTVLINKESSYTVDELIVRADKLMYENKQKKYALHGSVITR